MREKIARKENLWWYLSISVVVCCLSAVYDHGILSLYEHNSRELGNELMIHDIPLKVYKS